MVASGCIKRYQASAVKIQNPNPFRVATVVAVLTLSSVAFSDAYLSASLMRGDSITSTRRCRTKSSASYRSPIFASTAFRRVENEKRTVGDNGNRKHIIASGNNNKNNNNFVSTTLFSSPSDMQDEQNSAGVPDISATESDIDFMSVNDIDWAEMDPFHELPFDEYEELYLQGKAMGDPSVSTKSNPNCDASYESVMTEWDDSVPTLNHISLVGRVGNAPEARYFDAPIGAGSGSGGNFNSNKPNVVVSMSLALPRYYSAWEREQYGIEFGQEETEWYNLEVWGVLAEFAMKNVQKGARIGVVGSIDTDYYRNKQSDLLSTNPKLLVQDLDILESKMEADARRNNSYGNNNYSGGGASYNNNNNNNNSNRNYQTNDNMYGKGQQGEQERGPSFFTDDDGDEEDSYDPSRGAGGSAGGFFDPI